MVAGRARVAVSLSICLVVSLSLPLSLSLCLSLSLSLNLSGSDQVLPWKPTDSAGVTPTPYTLNSKPQTPHPEP